jgi:hypothetical protein
VLFTGWYLIDTSANGSRGAVGLVLGLLVATCSWSLGALVVERAVKGGLALPRRGSRRQRPARERRPTRRTGADAGRW